MTPEEREAYARQLRRKAAWPSFTGCELLVVLFVLGCVAHSLWRSL